MRRSLSFGVVVLAAGVLITAPVQAATIVIQPSNQDAFVQQDKPNRISSGNAQNQRLRVQSSIAAIPRIKRSLLQFDLSGIPSGAVINSAILALHEANNAGTPRIHGVHRLSGGWLQSTVKWNNQPSAVAGASSTVPVGVSRGTRLFTVTADVQTFINAPTLNHGWLVKDTAEVVATSGETAEITYNSRAENHIPDLPDRPKLTVDFTAPPCDTDADCTDTNACTVNEHCQNGFCAVTSLVCDDGNLCTDDICDPSIGCVYPLGECNDGFDCTTDSCNPTTGACTHTPVNAVCNGQCGSGTCVADPDRSDIDPTTGCFVTGAAPAGTPCGADGNPCTNDVCDTNGHCGVANTASCDDGDACTAGDVCAGGQCTSGTPAVCGAADACHEVGTCNPTNGQCSSPAKQAGAACSDGDACTQSDTCDGAGACVGTNPILCTALDQCHDAGTCNPANGACSDPPKQAGASCDDASACTSGDQCNGNGTCVGGPAVVCTASDQCHDAGTCNPSTGVCSDPPKQAGASCDDSSACTATDTCDGQGTCVGASPVICTALDECHDVGVCNPGTGNCSNPPKQAGASCSDDNACTQTDTCDGQGSCAGANPVVCSALDQCHDAGSCDPGTGTCSNPTKPQNTTCDDTNACTQTDRCDAGGTCVGTNPVVCSALDQCHLTGTCNPATGQCSNPTAPDGTSCTDGNACSLNDGCRSGACVSSLSAMCGDHTTQPQCGEQCDTGGVALGDCTAQCQFICGPTPQLGCRQPVAHRKGSFALADHPTQDKKDRAAWVWAKGAATLKSDFGSPISTTAYTLCVYDQSAGAQPIMRASIPAGGQCGKKPCWKQLKKGFTYRNKLRTPDGVATLMLRAGANGKARIALAGKGVPLLMPPSLPGMTSPVTVQLINTDGACFEAIYSAPFKKQKPKLFRDAAD